jgi:hypothetical protein
MAARQALMAFKSSSSDSQKRPQKTVNDYVDLIETVARVEYSRLPNHLIDFSEIVNIGAIAIHVLLTSNPEREGNLTLLIFPRLLSGPFEMNYDIAINGIH